ncbi:hypothetical protein PBY51_015433 [Eleginops maclovinus]|uniref:Uncharacterized protein n=1 Tax=Eleginops maclovinus TaxID=56733 RepID=A0AAN7WYA5_ELEMC|nr:hypothetical protein PBY51_015433 [Eleginops maclovinus]
MTLGRSFCPMSREDVHECVHQHLLSSTRSSPGGNERIHLHMFEEDACTLHPHTSGNSQALAGVRYGAMTVHYGISAHYAGNRCFGSGRTDQPVTVR